MFVNMRIVYCSSVNSLKLVRVPLSFSLRKLIADMVLKEEIETKNLVVKVREEICKRIKKLKF